MRPFIEVYREIVERFFGPLTRADGFSEESIEAAASRLGVQMPKTLFDFYRVAGRHDVHTAHHLLIPPSRLSLLDGMLAIYETDPVDTRWCIDVEPPVKRDPPVQTWIEELGMSLESGDALSEFLFDMFFTQCVSGGMSCNAMAIVSKECTQTLAADWKRLDVLGPFSSIAHSVYAQGKSILDLYATHGGEKVTVNLATQVESEFRLHHSALKVDWLLSSVPRS